MKKGRIVRQKAALARLEQAYDAFKKAGKDKEGWESTRRGFQKYHKGSTYDQECRRMANEIAILKEKISRSI